MSILQAAFMADSNADLLAGAGGLVTDETQSDHQGRKALLLVRNNEDCSEFIALAETMGININSFRIVGGMFLMVIAYQMVFEQRQKRREETVEEVMDDDELSLLATFPIATPLIAGPGAITLVMLLSEKSGTSIENQVVGFSPIIIVLILNAISLWASGKIAKRLPTSISSALQRTFGLLLGALAIEFVIEGLRQTFSI